ncbi:MAG: helix-turn-helix domain-containing protein [Defluviitaleaceae bacterium]|nr:helix-turn-helix domain-containing protein [Defluviitaleaceae bacterium]
MTNAYQILECVLLEIEENIKNKINAASLAKSAAMSSVHLQRLFRLAFEQPIASYIRSRKLAASLESLLKTNFRVVDIAEEYGFDYERSYIRAFKREFGFTPSEVRLSGRILKIVPPLQLIEKNKMGDGLFFGSELVMVPTFDVVGRLHKVPFAQSIEMAPRVAKDFWDNDRETIENRMGDDIYIGLTYYPEQITDFSYYLPSVPVTNLKNIPEKLHTYTFAASLCAKFHYIGQHHYLELNENVAKEMYQAIGEYHNSKDAVYSLINRREHFERIDKNDYDGVFCKMEWFTPVIKK